MKQQQKNDHYFWYWVLKQFLYGFIKIRNDDWLRRWLVAYPAPIHYLSQQCIRVVRQALYAAVAEIDKNVLTFHMFKNRSP